jgi:tagatose-1,6-bisphosphate aldolase
MTAMTTAERRGYQQICGEDGAMMVIACDQRGGMRTLMATTAEEQAAIGNDQDGHYRPFGPPCGLCAG